MMQEPEFQNNVIRDLECKGWKCIAHEWPVDPCLPQMGQGDLVFEHDDKHFVIETKMKPSSKVRKQAKYYALAWALKSPTQQTVYGIAKWPGGQSIEIVLPAERNRKATFQQIIPFVVKEPTIDTNIWNSLMSLR